MRIIFWEAIHSNISGDKNENSRGLSDYWFIKIDDTSGNLLWQKNWWKQY
jgi:hypothetical protein